VATVEPTEPDEPKPDPMWRAILDRRIYSRIQTPDGARCVELAIEPEAPPGGYTGWVVMGEPPFRRRYEGQAPTLSQPRVRLGDIELPLACATGWQGAWFLDESRCLDAATPDLTPSGCGPADEAAIGAMTSGSHRDAVLDRLGEASSIWIGRRETCIEHVVKKTKSRPSPREKPREAIALYPKSYGYPLHVTPEGTATLLVREVAERNPHRPPPKPGAGTIAIGCCSGPSRYHVLSMDGPRTELIRQPPAGTDPGPSVERWSERWAFTLEACQGASTP
jgi:hypothetical protein